jgi:hypothetical protein
MVTFLSVVRRSLLGSRLHVNWTENALCAEVARLGSNRTLSTDRGRQFKPIMAIKAPLGRFHHRGFALTCPTCRLVAYVDSQDRNISGG